MKDEEEEAANTVNDVVMVELKKSLLDRVFACGRPLSDSYTRACGSMLQNDKCVMCNRSSPGP